MEEVNLVLSLDSYLPSNNFGRVSMFPVVSIQDSLANTAKYFSRNDAKIAGKTKLLGEHVPQTRPDQTRPHPYGLLNSGASKKMDQMRTNAEQRNATKVASVWPPHVRYALQIERTQKIKER
jgi:hypothetical protein